VDFGSVLKRSWDITWKHKGLWVLGILAGCSASGRGSGGQMTSGFRGYQFEGRELQLEQFFGRMSDEVAVVVVLALLGFFLILSLVFLVLGVIGQGGLIAGFGRADDGDDVTLGEALRLGMQNFWRLLGIRITFWIAGLIVGGVIVVGVILFGVVTLGIGLICLLPLTCLLVPLAFALDAYITLAMVAAVEEKLGVFDSFGRAWQTLRDNLGPVIVMALILILGGGIVGAILALPFFAIGLPSLAGMALGTEQAFISGLIATGLLLIVALPIAAVFYGVLNTFITGAWTLTYRRLTGKPGVEEAVEPV
jgi:hypothetical protein